jgi:hypothetical protein
MNTREKMLHHVYRMRGQVLQFAIEVETSIELYITSHFVDDKEKRGQFIALILAPRVTFNDKFQIFQYLVEKNNPEFKEIAPTYRKDIPEMVERRNWFAHYPVDFSDEAQAAFEKDGTIAFVKLKNSQKFGLGSKAFIRDADMINLLTTLKQYAQEMRKLTGTASPPA